MSTDARRFSVLEFEQRSDEWRQARLGRVTGSVAGEMLAQTKSGAWSTSRQNLCVKLALERITGRAVDRHHRSAAMAIGDEREPAALMAYEVSTGHIVQSVGFVSHETLMAGYSPDGVIGDFEGLVEFKCPLPATHLEALKGKVVPKGYREQVMHGLWLTGARWCDWVSYSPEFPEPLDLVVVRFEPVEFDVAVHGRHVQKFLDEVDAEEEAIRSLAERAAS